MSIFILVTVYYVWVSDKNKFRSFLWGKKLALEYYVELPKACNFIKEETPTQLFS